MHLHTTAPAGSYEKMAVAIDTDSSMYNLMDRILQPMGEKLDKDMAELRAEIAKLSSKVATPKSRGSTPRSRGRTPRNQRRLRKTRKSRK